MDRIQLLFRLSVSEIVSILHASVWATKALERQVARARNLTSKLRRVSDLDEERADPEKGRRQLCRYRFEGSRFGMPQERD